MKKNVNKNILIINKPCELKGGIPILSLGKTGAIYTFKELYVSMLSYMKSKLNNSPSYQMLFSHWFDTNFGYYSNCKFLVYDNND